MSRPGASADPRRLALSLLLDRAAGRIDRVGPAVDRADFGDGRDRGFCRELVTGVLRYASLYETLARRHLQRGRKQPAPLLAALSLACHQLYGMDRVPPHAVVDTTVELLRSVRQTRLTGVANAVARKLARERVEGDRTWAPWSRIASGALPGDPAVLAGLPPAFLEDLAPRLRDRDVDPCSLNRLPHLCTRSLPGHAVDPAAAGVLRVEGRRAWWADPEPALRGPVAAGEAVVQDPSQAEAVALAEPREGETVLDACAAPGGKTRLLRELGCRVVAADRHRRKVAKLRADLGEAALVQDATRPALTGAFDLVVLDVPCSNSGVFARRPEAKDRYRPDILASLHALQRELLTAGADLVAPGGRLLYATCSLSPAENDGRVAGLAGWRVLRERWSWPDEWQGGGYAAVLERTT